MDQGNWVQVVDKDGWCQDFPLRKPIVYIGSDARNDIALSPQRGEGVAARHLQLVALPGGAAVYRAVNLSPGEIPIGDGGGQVLSPRDARDIQDRDLLRLGDFRLVFHLAGAAALEVARAAATGTSARTARAAPSGAIGLRLDLPDNRLAPDRPLDGTLTVQNLGNMPGVQFRLELGGLDPEHYRLGPGPILFPSAEKTVQLQLKHPRGPGLAAGQHTIRIRATASDAYPEQAAAVSAEIEVLPYYHHSLRLYAVD